MDVIGDTLQVLVQGIRVVRDPEPHLWGGKEPVMLVAGNSGKLKTKTSIVYFL